MAKLIKEAARDDAADVLREYWDGTFPVDPVLIARRLGIVVRSAILPDGVSGEIVKRDGQPPEILYSADETPYRQNFTCAHELGHYWDRYQRGDGEYAFTEYRNADPNNAFEFYADHFAANLMMPAKEFIARYDAGWDIDALMRYFGVSQQAIRTRIRGLRLDLDGEVRR